MDKSFDKKLPFKSPVFLMSILTLTLLIIGSFMYILNTADPSQNTWYDKLFMSRVSDSNTNTSVKPSTTDSYAPDSPSRDVDMGYGIDGKSGGITSPTGNDGGANNAKDQKLIKTGNISLTVNDFDKSVEKVRATAKSYDGLVTNSSDSGKDNDRSVVISIKVPASRFDQVMKELKAIGVTVLTSSENSSDITQTYLDLKARLKNQIALETQLVLILNKAGKVSEILEVQRQLSIVRGEIESMQSQIKYYDSQIDMSTITVSMKLNTQSLSVVDDTWMPLGTFRTAVQSLVIFAVGLIDFGIWMFVFSPIVLIPLAIYWIVKKARKDSKK